MAKKFKVTGTCIPKKNYMVNISQKLDEITEKYIDEGKYFTINRARQYGKTTMLYLLEKRLREKYVVIRLSFEAADEYFASPFSLISGLVLDIGERLAVQDISGDIIEEWNKPVSKELPMRQLGQKITRLCIACKQGVVLMIDEVDKSSDNQIFLSFLGLLRTKYLEQLQGTDYTFQSVILAGVYDIKNLKLKMHPDQEAKYNSPWNIAADFTMNMSFSARDIGKMLREYESDYHTGMNLEHMSSRIYEYTEGYPYFVSRICMLLDEKIAGTAEYPEKRDAWTESGFQRAVNLLIKENNSLFDDMVKKLEENQELKRILQMVLLEGNDYLYNPDNYVMNIGKMFGFVKDEDGRMMVANRIFEMRMYNLFVSEMQIGNEMSQAAALDKNQFVTNGRLNMELVLQKFQMHFEEIYGDNEIKFLEEEARKLFLIYIKPIINGTGNYYCEARTRTKKRTDLIIDYRGQQIIVEMKIWHGEEYNKRGEEQLFGYLEEYNLQKGYLLSFNFNKNKQTGIRTIEYRGKTIVEVVV